MSSKYADDDDEDYDSKEYDKRSEEKLDCHGNEIKSADAKGVFRLTGTELVLKVQEYFFTDDKFAKTFEDFIDSRSHIIDEESEEYKLEYTEVYDEYKAMFEQYMEGYIEHTLGSSIGDFYAALKSNMDEDETGNEALFGQILLGVTDFDIFMKMMRDSARKLRRK